MMGATTCVIRGAVLLFTAKTWTGRGATQPDGEELRRLREAKERAFEKARRDGGGPGGADAGPPKPLTPTLRAIWIAAACFLGALLLQALALWVLPGNIYLLVAAWVLHTSAVIAALWAIIHSAVVCAIRRTRED
ncbi:MAG: hypothetical protein R3F05_05835 [Planctomycetota bacterium]|nr:hypothetical protein [Planctomycetota bacterium]